LNDKNGLVKKDTKYESQTDRLPETSDKINMVNNFFYFNEEPAKLEGNGKSNPGSVPELPGSANKKRRHLTFNRVHGLKEVEKSTDLKNGSTKDLLGSL